MKSAVLGLAAVTAVYMLALLWVDWRGSFQYLGLGIVHLLGVMLLLNAVSVTARWLRWHWLLRRIGHRLPASRTALCYLAGFAFTASPGKVGELIRIRYFGSLGVPGSVTTGLFIYERSLDLIVVLALATFAFGSQPQFGVALAFVLLVVGLIGVLLLWPRGFLALAGRLEQRAWARSAILLRHAAESLGVVRRGLNGPELAAAASLGLVAWTVQAGAFAWLANAFGLVSDVLPALSIYPLAMLAGAASMLPGGIGSTEAVIVALLVDRGALTDVALLIAVITRVATLWSAIVVGVLCLALAERAAPAWAGR